MARASDYLVEGHTYHLTHRCHNRQHLLRFARDRDAYREWLREGVRRHKVPVFGYCVTRNHVHVIVRADNAVAVSGLMHLAAGSTAKQLNVRQERMGSLWEHPYQCTVIEDGEHLFNCLCYVDLNMVRAGEVSHPREWRWCGFDELAGRRQRYRLVDLEGLMERLQISRPEDFRAMYADAIDRRIAARRLAREPQWTESLAVGSKAFVDGLCPAYSHRRRLEVNPLDTDGVRTWTVRESKPAYDAFPEGKKGL